MAGLTVSAYARHRGCDRKTVVQAIQEGRISGAVGPDGTVYPERADALWAANTQPRRPAASPMLKDARQRHSLAQSEALAREIADLHANLVTPADAERVVAARMGLLAALLRELPAQCASPGDAARAVRDLFQAAQDLPDTPPPATRPLPPAPVPTTPAEAEALRLGLRAERQELLNAVGRGELVPIERPLAALEERLAEVRAHCWRCLPDVTQRRQSQRSSPAWGHRLPHLSPNAAACLRRCGRSGLTRRTGPQ